MSRFKGEGIIIGDDTLVVVTAVHGPKVRIGIQAPLSVSIHRYETAQKIVSGGGRLNEQGEAIERSRRDLEAEILSLKGQLALATKQ